MSIQKPVERSAPEDWTPAPDDEVPFLVLPPLPFFPGGNSAALTPPDTLSLGAGGEGKTNQHPNLSPSEPCRAPRAAADGEGNPEPVGETGPVAPSSLPLLPGLVPGGSVESILDARLKQIRRYGHTPERDLAQPLVFFAKDLESRARTACAASAGREDDVTRLEYARRLFCQIGAMALAAIDRTDAQLAIARQAEADALREDGLEDWA